MGLLQQTAEEVARAIGGAVDYVPEFELKDFKTEKIIVFPAGLVYEQVTRGSKAVEIKLEVGIAKRIKENEVPAMLERVEDLVQTIQGLRVVNGRGYCKEVVNDPAYIAEAMTTEQKFMTVLAVMFRVT